MDIIGLIHRIMNKSAGETFDPATDSLEAISDTLNSMSGTSFDPTTNSLEAISDKVASSNHIKTTTISLNQAAGSYDLFTGTTQPVILHDLIIRMPDAAAGGALTYISIQTNDTTPQIFISSSTGAVANLTAQAQLAWIGSTYIAVNKKIQLTIGGGATGSAYTADVVAVYTPITAGGELT